MIEFVAIDVDKNELHESIFFPGQSKALVSEEEMEQYKKRTFQTGRRGGNRRIPRHYSREIDETTRMVLPITRIFT